ncbi:hypothetical protein CVS47_02837 [Microbacterium lemovicicum]|uniref:Uncharacterized protein n=1 Tax=Microbacterium lemovicicum TaxID=1072463 RepID=A0A3Q9J056_9MICO|nr:hypothetical protein [Microbacterium lemovicicum]AZS38186.1 hypothetical protein CVS47_02837 [Microbacterium lemovicicum]
MLAMLSTTSLDIHVAATCTRHQFTRDPAAVIEQLQQIGPPEKLAPTIGRWIGYYDHPDRQTLIAALLAAYPNSSRWIADGAAMRFQPVHGTACY